MKPSEPTELPSGVSAIAKSTLENCMKIAEPILHGGKIIHYVEERQTNRLMSDIAASFYDKKESSFVLNNTFFTPERLERVITVLEEMPAKIRKNMLDKADEKGLPPPTEEFVEKCITAAYEKISILALTHADKPRFKFPGAF